MQKFKRVLTTLYRFFQASALQTAGLKAIQEMLNSPFLKIKDGKDVKWLSHDQAVQTLRRTLPAVLTALEREGAEHGDPVAIGLVRVMKCFEIVACLYLKCGEVCLTCHICLAFFRLSIYSFPQLAVTLRPAYWLLNIACFTILQFITTPSCLQTNIGSLMIFMMVYMNPTFYWI